MNRILSPPANTGKSKPIQGWVSDVAEAAKQNPRPLLFALGVVDIDAALSVRKFILPGANAAKAKINNPERGCGQCDETGITWKDYLDLARQLRGLEKQSDAAKWAAPIIGHSLPTNPPAPQTSPYPKCLRHIGTNQRWYRDYLVSRGLDQEKWKLLQSAGVLTAEYRCQDDADTWQGYSVLVFLVWGPKGSNDAPVNLIVARVDNGLIPTRDNTGKPDDPVKTKTIGTATKGSRKARGLIGDARVIDAMIAGTWPGKIAIKTEGISDFVAAMINDALPADAMVWTNPMGCRDVRETHETARWSIELFAEREVWVIHDADHAGQRGALGESSPGWCQRLQDAGARVKNIVLPYEIAAKKGKDLRDFLCDGGTMADIAAIAEQTTGFGPSLPAGPNEDRDGQKEQENDEAEASAKTEIWIKPDDPVRLAQENVERYRSTSRDIKYWRGEWYTFKGRYWEKRTDAYMKARLLGFIEERFKEHCEEETERYLDDIKRGKYTPEEKKPPEKRKISSSLVRNVAEATQTLCLVPDHIEFETRLESKQRRNYWAVKNGLLDLDRLPGDPADAMQPHTPDWFSPFCHEYQFSMEADCPQWLAFLNSVFLDEQTGLVDHESIDTLQRWFGYCMMPHIRLQKMLILDGVSRSGKGVIARVLKRLVGERHTASPKLRDFAGDFGLQPLLGKRLAVIGDAKLDRYRHDTEAILETLLGVIGEDSLDINIKRRDAATSCKLGVRFMLLCNGIPTLNDPAMAIVNRVVVLKFKRSFVGAEDTELTEKLYGEMDGIFLWSLVGYCQVKEDLRLPQPASGEDAVERFRRAVSPIRGFVDECCELGTGLTVPTADAFDAWQTYCKSAGRDHVGTKSNFLRQLSNAYPGVEEIRAKGINDQGETFREFRLVNIDLNEHGVKNVTQKRDPKPREGEHGTHE